MASGMNEQRANTDGRLAGVLGAAIAACALALATRHLVDLHRGEAADPYEAEQRVATYEPLRRFVGGEAKVGWLTSRTVGASEMDEVEYSIARYTLVPTLLCGHPDKPVIVTHFDREEELEAVLGRGEFQLVARVGPGMAVIRRRP